MAIVDEALYGSKVRASAGFEITTVADNYSSGGTLHVTNHTPFAVGSGTRKAIIGSDSFTYSVTQDSETATAVVTISVGPINDAPTIDSPLSLRAVSGATAVADLSISDVDGDALTLSLEGTDAASFSISSDGVLTFKTAPDFFAKSTYSVTVVASDGTLTTSQAITVNVFRAQTAGFEIPDAIAVIETL